METFFRIAVGGEQLSACLHAPEFDRLNTAAPVVICCHGLTGTRVGTCYRFVTLARRLVEMNMACLRFDFRGCGESDGHFQDVRPSGLLEDLEAAVAGLNRCAGCDPMRIGIVGSSFGAYTAALASPALDALRCLVFWAPVADPKALIDRDMTEEAWAFAEQYGWVDHHGLRMGRAFLEGFSDASAPAMLARTKRPVLIFHGRGDPDVPVSQGHAYQQALADAGVEVALETLAADDHGMRSVASNDAIIEGSAAWFQRFLHPEPPDETTA